MARSDKETLCARVHEAIEAYLDGEVSADETARLESHALDCQSCAEELALAKRVRLALRDLPEQRCPDKVADAVLREVQTELAAAREPALPVRAVGWRRRVWQPVLAGTVIIAVAIVALVSHRPQTPPLTATPEEIARAEQQVKWTLAYIGEISRRSAFTVRDDVLEARVVFPVWKAFTEVFETEAKS